MGLVSERSTWDRSLLCALGNVKERYQRHLIPVLGSVKEASHRQSTLVAHRSLPAKPDLGVGGDVEERGEASGRGRKAFLERRTLFALLVGKLCSASNVSLPK